MTDRMKDWVYGTIAVAMFAFLIVGLALMVLNAFAILGGASEAALRAVGVY